MLQPSASRTGCLLGVLCLAALVCVPDAVQSQQDPTPPEPPGRRVDLTDGRLFAPEGLMVGKEGVDLTLHLHGAAGAAERSFTAAKQPGVLVTVVLPGLSAVYTQKFRDPEVFARIRREVRQQLAVLNEGREPELRRVTVTSFSAGFGGVRELLKDPAAFQRIDALVMADSIYAGFTGDPAARQVDPANMAGFLRFAREAAAGRKRMLVTHTQLETPTYASTVETAEYLIRELGCGRQEAAEEWPAGLSLTSRSGKGCFEVLGFAGETGAEHMKHLHNLHLFLERVRK